MKRHLAKGLVSALIGQFVAGMCVLLFTVETAHAYSCGDPSMGHCYGVTLWQEQPEYFGAYADILRTYMACPVEFPSPPVGNLPRLLPCDGFVNNEIWLVDTRTTECIANPFKQCWVEAGYLVVDGTSVPFFFWADARPRNTSTFNLHILGPADQVGVIDHFMIIKDGRGEAGIFQVWIYNTSLSTVYHGTSTSNAMSGNGIIIGQELAGHDGFAGTAGLVDFFRDSYVVGPANFTRNNWAVQVLGPEFVFWYNSQIDTGSVQRSDNPPSGFWTLPPLSTGAPEGGQFTTRGFP